MPVRRGREIKEREAEATPTTCADVVVGLFRSGMWGVWYRRKDEP